MKLNDMLYDLLSLAKEESEPNRYAHSEEYDKLFNELDSKTRIIDELEEKLGCPLDVVIKALKYGMYAKDLPREELSKQFVRLSNVETEWYLINMIMVVNLKDYKKTWWLKKDKSE